MLTIKVDGIKTLKAQFDALAACLDPAYSEPIILRAAGRTESAVKVKAPAPGRSYSASRRAKGWAHTRDAVIRKKMSRRGQNPAPVIVGLDRKRAPQAQWLEYGTVKMAARPFLRPAWRETKRGVLSEIINGFRALIIRGEGLKR